MAEASRCTSSPPQKKSRVENASGAGAVPATTEASNPVVSSEGLWSESQLPEEYWMGDQHPAECGCHWCHLLYGNEEWNDAKFMEELEAKWQKEEEERQAWQAEQSETSLSTTKCPELQ